MSGNGHSNPSTMAMPPLLALRGIVKKFGTFAANDQIDLDVRRGEIHALLGENGAGKSTLVKMLYGLLEPTAGEIQWDGQPVTLPSPEAARARGIGVVFQHFSLFENLTVAENIAVILPAAEGVGAARDRIREIANRYGIHLQAERAVWTLSAGERQRIEIARCLLQNPQLLIFDEPTSVLTPGEAESLTQTLRGLRDEGRAILYISHKLEEVRALCDRATILRGGRVVATADPRTETARSLAAAMVGADIRSVTPKKAAAGGAARLQIAGLSLPADDIHGVDLAGIALEVQAGEIVGVAGIAGNGQSEFFAALSGETLVTPSSIRIDGLDAGGLNIEARRAMGAAFIPEERNGHAACADYSLTDNIILSHHSAGNISRNGFVQYGPARALAQTIIASFDVRTSGPDQPAGKLSGGNLQKFLVGREIVRAPGVLIVNQPTWGVDAAAAASIRQALIDLAAQGTAILVISQDLDDLFEISDRIAVLNRGRLSAPQSAHATTRDDIGLLMGAGQALEGGSSHAH